MTYPVDTATSTSLASDTWRVLIHIVTIRIIMVILVHNDIVLVVATGPDIVMRIARAHRAAGVWLSIDQGNA